MDHFLKGMSQLAVAFHDLIPSNPAQAARLDEISLSSDWKAVGGDIWWAIEKFGKENNLPMPKSEHSQLDLPFASK